MNNNSLQNDTNSEDFINLTEVFNFILLKKKVVIIVTFIAAILSVIYALSLPNIYKSEGFLMPFDPQDTLSSKISSLSPISSLAGFSLPDVQISNSQEAVERVKSFEFFSKSILPNIRLEDLMAAKSWDSRNNVINYDARKYNSQTKEWVKRNSSQQKIPSDQAAYRAYKRAVKISQDRKTTFVKISVEHKSPFIAKSWADTIISKINQSMREADQDLAKKSISYLNEIQETNNIQSIREATSLLLKQQMQTLMLTSSNENYVFKIIDPPIAPERKSRPSRSQICILGTFLGSLVSLLIIFIQNLREKYKIKHQF